MNFEQSAHVPSPSSTKLNDTRWNYSLREIVIAKNFPVIDIIYILLFQLKFLMWN